MTDVSIIPTAEVKPVKAPAKSIAPEIKRCAHILTRGTNIGQQCPLAAKPGGYCDTQGHTPTGATAPAAPKRASAPKAGGRRGGHSAAKGTPGGFKAGSAGAKVRPSRAGGRDGRGGTAGVFSQPRG